MIGGASAMLEGGKDLPTARVFPNYPGNTWPTPPVNKRDKKTVTFLLFDAHLMSYFMTPTQFLINVCGLHQCHYFMWHLSLHQHTQYDYFPKITKNQWILSGLKPLTRVTSTWLMVNIDKLLFLSYFFHAASTLWLMLRQYFCHQELRDTACSLPLK